jgi:hypothetical protein
MSYSFTVVAPSKSEAISLVFAELNKVVIAQPVHAADIGLAMETAGSVIGHLRDEPSMDVCVYAHGSVTASTTGISQLNVGCEAVLVARASVEAS